MIWYFIVPAVVIIALFAYAILSAQDEPNDRDDF